MPSAFHENGSWKIRWPKSPAKNRELGPRGVIAESIFNSGTPKSCASSITACVKGLSSFASKNSATFPKIVGHVKSPCSASRLSSIILMTCVRKLYDDGHMAGYKKRDDLALQKVAQHLPQLLEHNIENPVVPGLNLDEWSPNERADYVNRAFKLSMSINSAIGGSDPKAALKALQDIFGDRIPDDVSLVDTGSSVSAPSILTAGILRGLEEDPSVKSAVQLGSDQRYG